MSLGSIILQLVVSRHVVCVRVGGGAQPLFRLPTGGHWHQDPPSAVVSFGAQGVSQPFFSCFQLQVISYILYLIGWEVKPTSWGYQFTLTSMCVLHSSQPTVTSRTLLGASTKPLSLSSALWLKQGSWWAPLLWEKHLVILTWEWRFSSCSPQFQ